MVSRSVAESALLLACPAGERAVGRQRARLDPAGRVGVPAHVTLNYPFKQSDQLSHEDHDRLRVLFASTPKFALRCSTTGWFGDDFLFVALEDPTLIQSLIAAVARGFPEFPPYRGGIDEIVPHITVGFGAPVDVLRSAEREVQARLPFVQPLNAVELWAGPALASGLGPWKRVRSYPLGGSGRAVT